MIKMGAVKTEGRFQFQLATVTVPGPRSKGEEGAWLSLEKKP